MQSRSRWSKLRSSFQFKLFSIFTLLTLLLACLLSVLHIVNEIKKTHRIANEQLRLQAQQLGDSARLPLYAQNRDVLTQLALQTAQKSEIRAVVIIAEDGRVLADVHAPVDSANPFDPIKIISQTVQVYSSQQVDSVASSLAGVQDASVVLIGSVHLERGTDDLDRAIRHLILISIGSAIAFWLTVSSLSYLAFRQLTRSFNVLVQGIDAMQDGDLTTRINLESDDEAGRVARAVNNLANALQQRGAENTRLQEEHLHLERQMLHAQKLESLGVMAGGIAHDFNNLLQSILGNMELAKTKLVPDSASQKYIVNAMSSAQRAAQLTGLMLTYVGKGFITKKDLDLNEMIRENADMLRAATSAAVSMELCLCAELPTIIADEAHLQQVVMNLMSNAAESIERPSGLIRFTTGVQCCDTACLATSLLEEKPEAGSFVFLEVSDNGCGMDKDTIKRLFEPFFTTKFTGRGLGMSAVMGIIKTHGGALFVESEPGTGTTFRVLFPIPESAPPSAAHEPGTQLKSVAVLKSGKPLCGVALVVDDEKAVLRVCTKMVTLCGLTVITACDGVDAVAQFREHSDQISVVLMDLTMPNMDGITAMAEIYSIRPDSRIILSSGFNAKELGERISSQPPAGFIRKPYSMVELETELRRVMQADVH